MKTAEPEGQRIRPCAQRQKGLLSRPSALLVPLGFSPYMELRSSEEDPPSPKGYQSFSGIQ